MTVLENQNKTELCISSTGKIDKQIGNIPQLADIHQNLGRTFIRNKLKLFYRVFWWENEAF